MKIKNLILVIIVCTLLFLPGCEVIAGIFKAGFWAAIILVVIIAGLGIWGFNKFSGR
jgi:hypothetical protein